MSDLREAAEAAFLLLQKRYSGDKEDFVVMAALATALMEPVQQAEPLTCLWSPEDDDVMPGTYRSACGELWSFIDGGWKDNRVRYCHGCGGKVIEASSGMQEPKP